MKTNTQKIDLFAEESSALISISDVMAGLLIIFMIALVAFIINFQDAADKQEAVVEELTSGNEVRSQMIEEIRDRLEERGVKVEVDLEHGVLRLTEDAVFFRSGRATLEESQVRNLVFLGEVLTEVLPCYAAAIPEAAIENCDATNNGKLDSIFLEGHTDNVPIGRDVDRNWELSAQRAIETYRIIENSSGILGTLSNTQGEPLFSVSGYGFQRPINAHDKPTADRENRRIDLRFIMTPPKVVDPQRELMQRGIN